VGGLWESASGSDTQPQYMLLIGLPPGVFAFFAVEKYVKFFV
jgi:hypothetical protein